MKHSILVIEDDLTQRGVISETLQQFTDYDFVIANNTKTSFEIMEKLTPTLIIIDWELPKTFGNEFVSKIRKLPGFEITPILIITARDIENYIEDAIEAGATDYIRKPISKNIFHSRLKVMLRLALFQKEQASKTKAIEDKNYELMELTKSVARANRQLKKSESRYRTLAENFPNGVIGVYNSKLEAIHLSGKEFSALSINTNQFIGKTLEFIGKSFKMPNEESIHFCKEALKGKEQSYETEYNGNYYSNTAVPLQNEEGEIEQVMIVAQNITKIKEYEQKLLRTNLSKDRVLATVAHDLRSPIQTVKGMLGLMELSLKNLSERHKKLLAMVGTSCDQALDLISELLEISEMEDENYHLSTKKMELNDFITQTVKPFAHELKKKEITLNTEFSEEEIHLEINEVKFSRVIVNLLTNAKKFTSKGGQITVSTEIRNGNALISIADNGIGIPKDMQSLIFDKFSKASRLGLEGEKSTGLGMSIVKQIVELHKGKIWLKSEERKGTQFLILIPRVE